MTAADYCLRGDLTEEIQVDDVGEDPRLDRAITDASRVIDAFCRQAHGAFAPQTKTLTFDIPGSGFSRVRARSDESMGGYDSLRVPPLISVSQLATDNDGDGTYETIWTPTTDYLLYPLNQETKREIRTNAARGRYAFPEGQRTVQIQGSWGIVEDGVTPLPIRRACLLLAMIYYRRPTTATNSQGLGGAAARIGYQDMDVAAILWEVAGKYRESLVFA